MESSNATASATSADSGSNPAHVVDRLLDALTRGDVNAAADCYAPDLAVWHNSSDHVRGREESLQRMASILPLWSDLSYDDIRRFEIPGGVAQRHTMRGRGPDGAEFEVHMAMFVTLDPNGRIRRVDEYLDPSQLPQMG